MSEHPPDHDLLIRLDQKVDGLTEKVSKLTDDHERRIRFLERWVWIAMGAVTVGELALTIYLKLHE